MVIAFSRAGSLAVYKNFVDPFFFKGLNRDSSEDVLLMMMVEETFSYLNIKIISAQVEDGDECGFACAANPKCFSYNLEASKVKELLSLAKMILVLLNVILR